MSVHFFSQQSPVIQLILYINNLILLSASLSTKYKCELKGKAKYFKHSILITTSV